MVVRERPADGDGLLRLIGHAAVGEDSSARHQEPSSADRVREILRSSRLRSLFGGVAGRSSVGRSVAMLRAGSCQQRERISVIEREFREEIAALRAEMRERPSAGREDSSDLQ